MIVLLQVPLQSFGHLMQQLVAKGRSPIHIIAILAHNAAKGTKATSTEHWDRGVGMSISPLTSQPYL